MEFPSLVLPTEESSRFIKNDGDHMNHIDSHFHQISSMIWELEAGLFET